MQIPPGSTMCYALNHALKEMERTLGSSPDEQYTSCVLLFYLRKRIPVGVAVLEEVVDHNFYYYACY